MEVTANGEKCNNEIDAKRSAKRIKIMCHEKYIQDKLLAGMVIACRRPNLRRIVVVVLFSIGLVLISAKDSTIFKQSAVPVVDVLTFKSLAVSLRTSGFNIQKFYVMLTLRLCVLYGSQNKQRLLPYTSLADWFCITEVESVYCAVRTESLYKTHV